MDRFAFGKNWEDFANHASREDYAKAAESLRRLVGDVEGKTFLDIGSGSGLFSIAAGALGAKKVLGFDFDPKAVAAAEGLIEKIARWDGDVKKETVEFKVASILDENLAPGQFDIVYSWGVLHHTGDMYKAFENAAKLVAENGLLAIAIYNRHFTSPAWKMIKYTYVKSPAPVKKLMVYTIGALKAAVSMLTARQKPHNRKRGMRFYNDIVDWIGGYPYEYASKKEVAGFFESRGFRLAKFNKTRGWTGCNEYLFEKVK
ncbi:MAG: class I SAM-dependent methyltransferase [Sedimentisphaerales bacterium]|nr:class I SAM-dependent methyltransferase [Sedimentisphaerales bacterium]